MAGPVSDTYKLQYSRLVLLAVQQRKSRFEMGFTYAPDLQGRQKMVLDLVEPTTAIVNGIRGGDTPNIDANHEPVWVQPTQLEWGKLIEKEDYIKALTDYESPYVQGGAAAIVRARDLVFATAILGSRIIGLDGTTVQPWSNTFVSQSGANANRYVPNTVGSADGATATGMNTRKLQRAKRIFRQQYVEVDYEELWAAINAQGMEELYNDILTINTDYKKMAVLDTDTRTVNRVAGVDIVSYENITGPAVTGDAGADYLGTVWCKSGMYYGDFDPLASYADPSPGKKFRIQCYLENWFGATRSEDAKVVQIGNAQAPAGING
ncbi:MAG TPA: phage capsid protein [Stellaceae bacterium]|nr:phage capsid protein [Stellaceae bacterium]